LKLIGWLPPFEYIVLQTEAKAVGFDMDSGHRYGDMLASSATQWSFGGRGFEARAGDLAAYCTPGSHLDRYAARALNPVIRAAR
jgi:hypothetical protein